MINNSSLDTQNLSKSTSLISKDITKNLVIPSFSFNSVKVLFFLHLILFKYHLFTFKYTHPILFKAQ